MFTSIIVGLTVLLGIAGVSNLFVDVDIDVDVDASEHNVYENDEDC